MNFKTEDIVWVNLGKSYGWWPAQVQDSAKKVGIRSNLLDEIGYERKENLVIGTFVKFFDDDTHEWVKITDPKCIQFYSCKNKKKFIKAGFRSLDENKKRTLGGTNLRLAQFYKDVELAEVMTDNDVEVANILSMYEISENIEDEPTTSSVELEEPKKKNAKNDTLRSIKKGRVRKSKKRGKKK